ncbi:hypothetical protein [Bordetella genomosp. 1]|uniref:hypothetical protein n=1 Tax=Bordetella genomosp. 1 TaxID=1395607 RepID=UPI001C52F49F|nr:hypothetical protein [Bordetella genomosp. 1]
MDRLRVHSCYAGRGGRCRNGAPAWAARQAELGHIFDPLNAGSVGVVERRGLRREAHLIENDRNGDAWGDERISVVLARAWRARGSLRAQPLPCA